jgi:hypothetical protein
MKIYEPKPIHLIRLTITKKDEETKYLNFIDVTQEDCIKKVTSIIDELKLSVFQGGNQTRMDFRDCIGGKNGKCKSVSFKGLNPKELHKLLIDKIEKKC